MRTEGVLFLVRDEDDHDKFMEMRDYFCERRFRICSLMLSLCNLEMITESLNALVGPSRNKTTRVAWIYTGSTITSVGRNRLGDTNLVELSELEHLINERFPQNLHFKDYTLHDIEEYIQKND